MFRLAVQRSALKRRRSVFSVRPYWPNRADRARYRARFSVLRRIRAETLKRSALRIWARVQTGKAKLNRVFPTDNWRLTLTTRRRPEKELAISYQLDRDIMLSFNMPTPSFLNLQPLPVIDLELPKRRSACRACWISVPKATHRL